MPDKCNTETPKSPSIDTKTAIRLLEEGGVTIDPTTIPDADVLALCRTRQAKDGDILPIKTARNLALILTHDHRLKGKIRYNKFEACTTLKGVPVTDTTDLMMADWVEMVYRLQYAPTSIANAMALVGARDPYHPVCDYLDGLEWDQNPRLDRLLVDYFGAHDSLLNRVISRKWAVSMVARARKMGCKVDTCLVLAGAQGIRKSTGLRALAGADFFSDTLIDVRSKDAYQMIQGVWCYELAELSSVKKADLSAVKGFVSAQSDRYRASYGRHVEKHPRCGVFVGTTNEIEFLSDTTGNRRWWIVKCKAVDLENIHKDRDQIWAEADQAYRASESWWLDASQSDQLDESNEMHMAEDPWMDIVQSWLARRVGPFTIDDMMEDALQIDPPKMRQADRWRAGRILRTMDIEKRQIQKDGKRTMMWFRPGWGDGSTKTP